MLTSVDKRTGGATPPTWEPKCEITWVGRGGWVACDRSVARDDPRRVLAYVECDDDRVHVVWVRGRTGVTDFGSLRHAVEAVDDLLRP